MKIVALDVGQGKSVACIYETQSGEARFQTLPTTPAELQDLLAAEAPARLVMEVGPLAGWICDLCRALGVAVQVADPTQEAWRWKGVKRKTDRDDALKLARLSAMNQINEVHVPAPEVRAWRERIKFRAALVARRTAIKNSIRSILTRQAIGWPPGARGWSQASLRQLRAMAAEPDGACWRAMLAVELAQLAAAEEAIATVEQALDEIAAADERVQLLRTIPAVGPRLAETIVAIIDDPHRFGSGKEVGSYAGLAPRTMQSGQMDRQGRISRRGPALLRSLLVEVSWIGLRWNPWMKRVYERALRGSPSRRKIAIVAVARRLLVVCWAMLRDGTRWRDPESAKLRLVA